MPLATSIVYGLIDAPALARRPSTGSPTSTNARTAPPLHHNDDANGLSLQLNVDDDAADMYSVNATSFGPHLPCTDPSLSLRHEDGCIMARTMSPPPSSMSLNRQCYTPEDDDATGMNGIGVRRPAPPPSSLLDSHFHHHLCCPPSILPCITTTMQTPPAPSLLSEDNNAVDKNSVNATSSGPPPSLCRDNDTPSSTCSGYPLHTGPPSPHPTPSVPHPPMHRNA
ncbi:hypothetical protein BDQ17DRAFT_1433518 [Cyathus striatus]|nr:hypothetical protein BDQ17DRAFT_1433518 [Cyathus striatus]